MLINKLYAVPNQTRFSTEPNTFLVAAAKAMQPGKALDVAMGQGRNAVHLALQGWDVTGFDVADEGLRVANENAARAGTRLTTVTSCFEDFDYGIDRWDLITFIYTDAPVIDPGYVARIIAALKPGGFVLIERPYRPVQGIDPELGPPNEQDKPNALLKAWPGLQVVYYEDKPGIADWQQTSVDRNEHPMRIVRLLARKL